MTEMTETVENISMTIKEIQSAGDDYKIPVYYKYRYTFPKDTTLQEQKKLLSRLINFIKERYACDNRLTASIEHFTKGKLATKPHIHIHFISKRPSNTIRKGIALHFEFVGRCQCCKPEPIVEEKKFFKYPLKQQKNDTKVAYHSTFTDEETIQMIDSAYDVWITAGEVLVNKLEKRIERTSEDRLFHCLDLEYSATSPPSSYKQILNSALLYYANFEPTFNYNTIIGYVDKYLIIRKIISIDTYISMKGTADYKFV